MVPMNLVTVDVSSHLQTDTEKCLFGLMFFRPSQQLWSCLEAQLT